MFSPKDEVSDLVDAVYALVSPLDRGQVLPFDSIIRVLQLPPHEGSWDHVMRRVGRRLQAERGIAFWPNFRGGYLLCTVDQQLRLPAERAKRSARQLRKGKVSTEAIHESSLSTHQRRLRAFLADHMREAEKSIKQGIRVQNIQLRREA